MTLRDLTELKYNTDREERPNVPAYAIPRTAYTDKTANGLTKAFCDLVGVMCQRTGSEGRFRPGQQVVDVIGRTRVMKGTWLPGLNEGQGDLLITLKGKAHWVEVKIGKDRQSDVQKDFEAKAKRAGAVYVVVKSWGEFYNNYMIWKRK